MKFLHVADLHVDRSFEGLGFIPQELSGKLSASNLEVLKKIVNHGIEQQVDFILIVGDTFHHAHVTIQMQALFLAELERLKIAGIPVVLSFGNHDYYEAERYWFDFPENVLLFTEEKVRSLQLTTKKGERVSITGFSYQERWLEQPKLTEFPLCHPEADYQIGCYHGQLADASDEQGRYAPFRLSEMKQKGYDYWALGHIHQPQILAEQPLIVYPGTPQGHSIKEVQTKGVMLVEFTGSIPVYDWLTVEEVEWSQPTVDISKASNLREVLNLIEAFFNKQKKEKLQLIRLVLVGEPVGELVEFQREIKNKGLLAFLQPKIYQETAGKVWVYQVNQEIKEAQKLNLPLGVDQSLLTQISQRYLVENNYYQAIEHVLGQSLLATQMGEPQDYIKGSEQKIIQALGWHKEVE